MSNADPDFTKLQQVNAELERLYDDGALTVDEWERLFADAEAAAGTHTEFLEGTLMLGMRFGMVSEDDEG